ncbi:hypothetical protein BGZ98_009944 [Dissophora globulifera]|nr:hypothetical protein BGZ98_009944 [Dissophora globulifera]
MWVSCAIQWRLYCKNKWVTYFSYLYISFGLYFVVATRLHYTVDVVLAVFITFATWSLYIGMIDVVMEHEYFGIQSHHEKYAAFDAIADDYEFTQVVDDEESDTRYIRGGPAAGVAPSGSSDLHARRRQLEHYMNRLRGPRIGYGLGEHDRVAFLPMQFNLWLKCLIRWCDGLDLRMRPVEFERSADNLSRWEEYVLRYRSEQISASVRSGNHSTLKHRKMNEGFEEEDDSVEQVYYREGLRFESTGVHDYSNGALERQQQQGRWRPVPMRSATSHSSRSTTKDKSPKWTDNSRKLRILKIALIVFVNAILLAKVVQVIHNRAATAQSSHWPKDMESYPGGTIYENDSQPPVAATPDSQVQRDRSNFKGPDHSHGAEEDVQIEQEEEESEYRREHERRHYPHHRHQGEHRHHWAEREWIPEGAI